MVARLVPALPWGPDFEVNWGLKRALLLSRIGPLAITDVKAKDVLARRVLRRRCWYRWGQLDCSYSSDAVSLGPSVAVFRLWVLAGANSVSFRKRGE